LSAVAGQGATHGQSLRLVHACVHGLRRFLRSGLLELDRRHQLLDVLDLEKPALVLVVCTPGIRPPALGRLAVAEVEEVRLRGGSVSSASEHLLLPSGMVAWAASALGYLSLRSIGGLDVAENPPIR
jgi:hypothetical protein